MTIKNKFIFLILFILIANTSFAADSKLLAENSSRITDEVIPLALETFPERPRLLLEVGDPFLETGPISEGFELPTGAVWQPSFMMWGTYRSAIQFVHDGNDYISEWANRFDLFGNLYLTPTERILAGVRFLDQEGNFTGYTFAAPDRVRSGGSGYDDETNFEITTLFFEGDFGELFPNLDLEDKRGLDVAISVGRQLINYQDGMLINDNIDAIGLTKINLRPKGVVNYRSSLLYAWNEINRINLPNDDNDSQLYGWFNEIDWRKTTVEFDAIYVDAGEHFGDGFFAGLGATQRIGNFNTTLRILGSAAIDDETEHNRSGTLVFGELSWTPHHTHNHVYINAFRGFDQFRSASRDPLAGGPLGRAGVLFASVGLGRYSAALSSVADEAYGGAIGYQMFFDNTRKQLLLELGGRYGLLADSQRAIGPGLSYQMAIGQRSILRFDAYAIYEKDQEARQRDEMKYGARLEFVVKF